MAGDPKPEPGDVIDLSWGDYPPDWYAVRGHVTADEFRDAWDGYWMEPGRTSRETDEPRQCWARWTFAGQDEWGNAERLLSLYATRKPGRFPVTVGDRARA